MVWTVRGGSPKIRLTPSTKIRSGLLSFAAGNVRLITVIPQLNV